MKKFPLTTLSILLIIGGWFLEVYYYQFRFVGDGTPFAISIIIGATLTLLLTGLFLMKNVGAKIGRVGLICLSVWFTWAGQNYSYNESQNINSVKNSSTLSVQDKHNNYAVRISGLEKTIQQKDSMLPDNLKDRTWLNKNGVQPLLEEIESLKVDLKYYELLRDSLDLSTTMTVNKSAYEMLAEDLGLTSPTPLKLVSQVILSLFIALIAPCGIRILSTVYTPTEKRGVVKKARKEIKKQVNEDIYTRYTNSKYDNTDYPLSLKGREGVVKETGISYNNFNKLAKLEKDLNLVTKTGNKTIPNVSRAKFEMMLRNKTAYAERISVVR